MRKMKLVSKSQKVLRVEDKYGAHFSFPDLCKRLNKLKPSQHSLNGQTSLDLPSTLKSGSYLVTEASLQTVKRSFKLGIKRPPQLVKGKLKPSNRPSKLQVFGHRRAEDKLKQIYSRSKKKV